MYASEWSILKMLEILQIYLTDLELLFLTEK